MLYIDAVLAEPVPESLDGLSDNERIVCWSRPEIDALCHEAVPVTVNFVDEYVVGRVESMSYTNNAWNVRVRIDDEHTYRTLLGVHGALQLGVAHEYSHATSSKRLCTLSFVPRVRTQGASWIRAESALDNSKQRK